MQTPTPGAFDVTLNDLTIHGRVDGTSDAPWLVLLNPLGTNLSIWDDLVAAYGPSYRVLRYDQRGHGATAVPTRTTIDLLIDDVTGLLDHVGCDRATAIGVSMGAATALGLTARHPQRVERVVASDGQWASPAGSLDMWKARIADARVHGMSALADATIQRWFTPATVAAAPPAVERVRRMIASTAIDGYAGCAQALGAYDMKAEISAITTPTLLIVGAADGALPKTMREMHDAIVGSDFVEIADAGHVPHVEQPDAFLAAVDSFLGVARGRG